MRKKIFCPILFALVLFSHFAYSRTTKSESTPIRTSDILGTWKLHEFFRVTPEGKEIPWCENAHGILIYAADGYMSAAINCSTETPESAPSKPYGNRLLYAGKYKFKNQNDIAHQVMNSSQLDILGQEMVRHIETLSEGKLVFTENAANKRGAFRIEWRRP